MVKDKPLFKPGDRVCAKPKYVDLLRSWHYPEIMTVRSAFSNILIDGWRYRFIDMADCLDCCEFRLQLVEGPW